MRKKLYALVVSVFWLAGIAAAQGPYQPTWESLDSRPNPAWFAEAKFGIFIHWGVYSVPAWGPKGSYAEWYWRYMNDDKKPTSKYHARTYGKDFRYQDFAPMFKAELFDPAQWADLFARAGARYVVLTSKHHDGFCLWPSPDSWNWNSVDIGPHRDLAGDLTEAVRARGLKMGFYYSLYEWFHPLYKSDPERFVNEHMIPQFKDLVERYQPSLIFSDGEWEHPNEMWKSRELLAWLFNESAARDDVVVNDRWGKDTRSRHGGYFTTEYGRHHQMDQVSRQQYSWEENRGIGGSYGFNRNEALEDYSTSTALVHLLIETVSRGGNLLLNVGPTADGRIPVIMQQRLMEIGEWLAVNGEAIYGTRPWRVAAEGELVRYTSKDGAVYAICLDWPGKELTLAEPKLAKGGTVTLVGREGNLRWKQKGGKLEIQVPALSVNEAPSRHAYVFKLTGVE